MARDTSKDITHENMRARLSDKSKQTASSLKELASPKSSPAGPNLNNAEEILGAIYELMVKNREQTVKTREDEQTLNKKKKKQDDTQHQEILKALTVRRKPGKKKKPEEAKKEEPKKPEEAKKEEPKKPEEKAPETKGTDKAGQEAKDKAAQAAKDKAAQKAKQEAEEKAKLEAKKKAEAEAKKKAEQEAKDKAAEKAKQDAADKVKKDATDKAKKDAAEAEKNKPSATPAKEKPEIPTAKPVKPPPAPPSAGTVTKVITGIAAAATGLVPLLAKAESPDYNLLVHPKNKQKGITPPKPLTKMTVGEVLAFQDEMSKSKMYPSNAVGKYQIIQGTLKEGVEKLKIPLTQPFDEKTQDRLYYEFLTGSKRKNLNAYLTGKVEDTPENLAKAQLDMAKEFASFGVPYRIWREEARKKNGDLIWDARWIEQGQSYYVGSGGNKASVTPESSAKAIKEERNLRLNTQKASPVSSTPNSGTTTDQLSQQNAELLAKAARDKASVNIINQSTNVQQDSQTPAPQPKVDDRPVWWKKLFN